MTNVQLKFQQSFAEVWELLQQRNKGMITTVDFQKKVHKLNPYPRRSDDFTEFKDHLTAIFDESNSNEDYAGNGLYVFSGDESIVELFNLGDVE